MEAVLRLLPEKAVPKILHPTRAIFMPLLTARKSQIAQTPKKTFQFGSTERHQVDVYYPPPGTSNAPILFFVYGGGFASGARNLVPGLLFDNIGAFFAQRGILTAIADYRLAPETTYPGPVYDIRDAIRFTLSSSEVDVAGSGADKTRVYVLADSAGGAHAATVFLNEKILEPQDANLVKGLIIMSGAYASAPGLSFYYGDDGADKCPLALLKNNSAEKIKQLLPPRLFLMDSEYDDDGIMASGHMFREALREKGITDFHDYTMEGHNHISPEVSLSSGEGEEWGEEVTRWIKA